MRTMLVCAALFCGALLVTDANYAGDKKKEVVLKGLVACYKCEFGKGTECATLIQVKSDKDKEGTLYFFDAAAHKKYHDGICANAKEGTVTGTVKDVEKKKVISVTKVEYK